MRAWLCDFPVISTIWLAYIVPLIQFRRFQKTDWINIRTIIYWFTKQFVCKHKPRISSNKICHFSFSVRNWSRFIRCDIKSSGAQEEMIKVDYNWRLCRTSQWVSNGESRSHRALFSTSIQWIADTLTRQFATVPIAKRHSLNYLNRLPLSMRCNKHKLRANYD